MVELTNIRSGTATTYSSDVFFNWMMHWLTKGGSIRRVACGRIMCVISCR